MTYDKLHFRRVAVRSLSRSTTGGGFGRSLPPTRCGALGPLLNFHLRHYRGVRVLSQTDAIVVALEGVHVKQLHVSVIF